MPGGGSPSLSSSSAAQRAHRWLRRRFGRRRGRRAAAAATAGMRRMLVTVTVVGSTGPIRFVAGEEDPVAAVIGTALQCYAREGRFPAMGCDAGEFHLFCARSDYMEPLDHAEAIGAHGARDFTLCSRKTLPRAPFLQLPVTPPPLSSCSGAKNMLQQAAATSLEIEAPPPPPPPPPPSGCSRGKNKMLQAVPSSSPLPFFGVPSAVVP